MRDVVVVDASLALKWVIVEHDSIIARAQLTEWGKAAMTLIAPALFIYEVTNILYRSLVHAPPHALDEAKRLLEELFRRGLIFEMPQDAALSLRAMELARQFRLSATYDAHYLALAEREGCDYWTADERLWNSVRRELAWVRWLGSFHPPA